MVKLQILQNQNILCKGTINPINLNKNEKVYEIKLFIEEIELNELDIYMYMENIAQNIYYDDKYQNKNLFKQNLNKKLNNNHFYYKDIDELINKLTKLLDIDHRLYGKMYFIHSGMKNKLKLDNNKK